MLEMAFPPSLVDLLVYLSVYLWVDLLVFLSVFPVFWVGDLVS